MSNLLDLVKDQLTDGVMDSVSSLIGESSSTTSAAVGSFLPALLEGVISKGSTESGAESLIGMINDNDLGGGLLGNLGGLLGGGESSSTLLKMGGSLLSGLLGNNQSTLLNALMQLTGLKKSSSSSLLSILAPIAMSVIGSMIKKKGLNAGGLLKYLTGERNVVASALPAGFASLGATSAPSTSSSSQATSSSGGFNAVTFGQDGNYFNNQPYIVDRESGQIVQLEKGVPEMKTSTIAAPFYASSSSSWMMKGDRSNVRLSSNGGFNFVVKVAPGLDPMDYIKLVRFDLLKQSRRDPSKDRHMPSMKTTGTLGGASSEQITENNIRIEVKRLADGVYEVIPQDPIGPNEYAFYIMHKFYAFGID